MSCHVAGTAITNFSQVVARVEWSTRFEGLRLRRRDTRRNAFCFLDVSIFVRVPLPRQHIVTSKTMPTLTRCSGTCIAGASTLLVMHASLLVYHVCSEQLLVYVFDRFRQATLLNSYLVQLLDNGFLHADPHPGNFLLQDDGTLCVLDFGLMTEVRRVKLPLRRNCLLLIRSPLKTRPSFSTHVLHSATVRPVNALCLEQVTEEQSYALLEYVCHLIAKDYPATLDDLIVLGELAAIFP